MANPNEDSLNTPNLNDNSTHIYIYIDIYIDRSCNNPFGVQRSSFVSVISSTSGL